MANKQKLEWTLPAAVLIIAALLRFYHLDFGRPFTYHPDEIKLIAQAGRLLDTRFMDRSAHFGIGVYPPFFTYMLAGALGGYIVLGLVTGRFETLSAVKAAYQSEPFQFFFIGRVLSAMLGVAVVLLIYLIGRRLYSKTIGLLVALLSAVNMALVNHAHFSTVDTAAAFWGLLCVYSCVRIGEEGLWRHYLFAALFAALATATKFNMALFFLPIVIAHLSRFPWRRWFKEFFSLRLITAGVVGVAGLLLAFPLIWLDFQETFGGLRGTGKFEKIGKIGSGGGLLSYWTGDQSDGFGVFYPNSLPGTFGVLLTILCGAGILFLLFRRKKADVLLLVSLLPMYFLFETMSIKAIRHLTPIVPLLLLAGAAVLYEAGSKIKRYGLLISAALLLVIMVDNISHSVSYWHKMSSVDPRTRAREWILVNLPPKALLLTEDFPPPLPLMDGARQDEGYIVTSVRVSAKRVGIADSVKALLKTERKLYYIADGFSRQIFGWEFTRRHYPDIAWDRVQFFDWLDRNGRLLKRFDSVNPRLQPEIFIYELTGKKR